MRHRFALAAVVLLVLILAFAAFRKPADPDILADLPELQQQFCQALSKGNLNDALGSLGSSGKFAAWHGQGSVHLRDDGKTLGITFSPVCPDSNTPLTLEDETGVPAEGSLGYTLQKSDFSHGMIISGEFNPSSSIRTNGTPLVGQLKLISPGHFSQRTSNSGWFASLFQSGLISPVSGALKAPAGGAPTQQRNFCQLLLNHQAEAERLRHQMSTEYNPFRAGQLQEKQDKLFNKLFDDLYSVVGASGTFTNWRGKITLTVIGKLFVDRPEHIELTFNPHCPAMLATAKDHFTDTHIPFDSPLTNTLQSLDVSKDVIISGQFLWAPPYPKQPDARIIPVDNSHHFYPSDSRFTPMGCCGFVVRITSVSPQ